MVEDFLDILYQAYIITSYWKTDYELFYKEFGPKHILFLYFFRKIINYIDINKKLILEILGPYMINPVNIV